jgi:ribosomal protein S18 acetylase RimI-like enzyme
MAFITLTLENIDNEHICCAISDKKGETCVSSKKAWLAARIPEGLVFTKLDQRGKVFIEYMPAEKAWCPIEAPDYMYINCFWVSGQFKGQGYANQLLTLCMDDAKAKGKRGIAVLSSRKKMTFLSDPDYLKHMGFRISDTAAPYFDLLYLPFDDAAPVPRFKDCAKSGQIDEPGMVLYYTNQCPHTNKYVPLIREIASANGFDLTLHKIETMQDAQAAPSPFTTYSFFSDGEFVTNEIFSEKKFEKYLEARRASSALQ